MKINNLQKPLNAINDVVQCTLQLIELVMSYFTTSLNQCPTVQLPVSFAHKVFWYEMSIMRI